MKGLLKWWQPAQGFPSKRSFHSNISSSHSQTFKVRRKVRISFLSRSSTLAIAQPLQLIPIWLSPYGFKSHSCHVESWWKYICVGENRVTWSWDTSLATVTIFLVSQRGWTLQGYGGFGTARLCPRALFSRRARHQKSPWDYVVSRMAFGLEQRWSTCHYCCAGRETTYYDRRRSWEWVGREFFYIVVRALYSRTKYLYLSVWKALYWIPVGQNICLHCMSKIWWI
jgi:hypothetical protein